MFPEIPPEFNLKEHSNPTTIAIAPMTTKKQNKADEDCEVLALMLKRRLE
jgi:hypothetical protein